MKLIRDKLAQRITDAPIRIVMDNKEFKKLLLEKLIEEIGELAESNYKDVFEYADVIEVILAIAHQNGFTANHIDDARREKNRKNGSFIQGSVLEATDEQLSAQKLKELAAEQLVRPLKDVRPFPSSAVYQAEKLSPPPEESSSE